jgi:hypothetical protein
VICFLVEIKKKEKEREKNQAKLVSHFFYIWLLFGDVCFQIVCNTIPKQKKNTSLSSHHHHPLFITGSFITNLIIPTFTLTMNHPFFNSSEQFKKQSF